MMTPEMRRFVAGVAVLDIPRKNNRESYNALAAVRDAAITSCILDPYARCIFTDLPPQRDLAKKMVAIAACVGITIDPKWLT